MNHKLIFSSLTLLTIFATDLALGVDVTTTTDNGSNTSPTAGSLRAAILQVNTVGSGSQTINCTPIAGGTINLASSLPAIALSTSSDTVNIQNTGSAITVNGGGNKSIFSIAQGDATLANFNLQNGLSKGGNGGAGIVPGGGGAGGGGGLYVHHTGSVSLSNVVFSNNVAQGGTGGSYNGAGGAGGGGGGYNGGNGGSSTVSLLRTGGGGGGHAGAGNGSSTDGVAGSDGTGLGGAGGGYGGGTASNGGNAQGVSGSFTGGAGSGAVAGGGAGSGGNGTAGGSGGTGGNGFGNVTTSYGGGGGGGGNAATLPAGRGAGGGGGNGGVGGLDGGGGGGYIAAGPSGTGAEGGFGAGGGAGGDTGGGSLFGGGYGGTSGGSGGGGGGAGMGGAIFVQDGATLNISNAVTFSGNSSIAGASGGGDSFAGQNYGPDIFLRSGSVLNFNNTLPLSITSNIDSNQQQGGGTGGGVNKNGTGTLTLGGNNSFSGILNLNQGTLRITNDHGLGSPDSVALNNGTTLVLDTTLQQEMNFTLSGTTTIEVNSDSALGGHFSGTGSLVKTGPATLNLISNNNSFSGGLFINDGTVLASYDAGFGTGPVTFGTGTTLTIDSPSMTPVTTTNNMTLGTGSVQVDTQTDYTIDAVVSGAGQLIKDGPADLILVGTNTYQGGTRVKRGKLRAIVDANLGLAGLALEIEEDATFQADETFSIDREIELAASSALTASTISNVAVASGKELTAERKIKGSKGLKKMGAGELILKKASEYAPETEIAAGRITLDGDGALPLESAVNLSDATSVLDISASNATALTYSNVEGVVGSEIARGVAAIDLTMKMEAAKIYAGDITGAGEVRKAGSADLSFEQPLTYVGDTYIDAGALRLANIAVLPTSTELNLAAAAAFDLSATSVTDHEVAALKGEPASEVQLGSNNLTSNPTAGIAEYKGDIKGAGKVSKKGAGKQIFRGENSYTGGTDVDEGTLEGHSNALQGNINNNAVLAFNQDNDVVAEKPYTGALTGTGTLEKKGAKKLTVSGPITQTAVTVTEGLMSVNNTLNSPVTVAAAGTLGGTGPINGVVTNNGRLAPGNSIGILTVNSNVNFNAGSSYEVEFDAVSADLLDVTGSVTIDPTSTIYLMPLNNGTFSSSQQYTIINTSGGITNQFGTVINTSPVFQGSLTYLANQLLLTVDVVAFSELIQGGNPGSVAAYMTPFQTTATGDLATVINQLSSLSLDEMREAFEQISPDPYKGMMLANQENIYSFQNSLGHRLDALAPLRCSPCEPNERRNQIWADSWGQWGRQTGHSDLVGYNNNTYGGLFGFDYRASPRGVLGAVVGYSNTHLHNHSHRGHGTMQSYYGGGYGAYYSRIFFLDLSATGIWNDIDEQRNIVFGTINRTAKTNHHAYAFSADIRTGFRFNTKAVEVRPFGAVNYVYMHERGFDEHGADSLNLHVRHKMYGLWRSEAGLDLYRCFAFDNWKWIPRAKASGIWENRPQGTNYRANLRGEPGSFVVEGVYPNRFLYSLDASMQMLFLCDRFSVEMGYRYMSGKKYISNEGNIQLIGRF